MFSLENRQAARDSLWGTQSGEWDVRAAPSALAGEEDWAVPAPGSKVLGVPAWAAWGSSGTSDELLSPTPAPLKQVPYFSCFPILGSPKSSKEKNIRAESELVNTGMCHQSALRLNPGFAITHRVILRQGQLPDV